MPSTLFDGATVVVAIASSFKPIVVRLSMSLCSLVTRNATRKNHDPMGSLRH